MRSHLPNRFHFRASVAPALLSVERASVAALMHHSGLLPLAERVAAVLERQAALSPLPDGFSTQPVPSSEPEEVVAAFAVIKSVWADVVRLVVNHVDHVATLMGQCEDAAASGDDSALQDMADQELWLVAEVYGSGIDPLDLAASRTQLFQRLLTLHAAGDARVVSTSSPHERVARDIAARAQLLLQCSVDPQVLQLLAGAGGTPLRPQLSSSGSVGPLSRQPSQSSLKRSASAILGPSTRRESASSRNVTATSSGDSDRAQSTMRVFKRWRGVFV
jgi:hypothetical protein